MMPPGQGGMPMAISESTSDLRKLFDLPEFVGPEFVAIDNGIVLVGEQRLFATPLAAEDDKGKARRQVGKAVLAQQRDQAQENLVVEMGNHAHHVANLRVRCLCR
jgi:hypothetical protein